MIAVDASAVLAVLLREPDADDLIDRMQRADRRLIGAPTTFECHLALSRFRNAALMARMEQAIADFAVEIVPFEARHIALAHDAQVKFGRGNHPASLNFGDCMAYAVAKAEACPLLFKGNDFSQTDITPA